MSKYIVGVTHKQFSDKGGYAYLCASIISSAVNAWKNGKFDIMKWLGEGDNYNLYCDYLGLDRDYLKMRLQNIERVEGSGIVRREYK